MSKETLVNDVTSNEEKDKIQTVFINIDYLEKKVNVYWKSVLRTWNAPQIKKLILFVDILSQKYCSSQTKDKLNMLSKSNVAYQFSCPGCEPSYNARTLFKRTKKYVSLADSAIKGHLDNCSNV